MKLLIIGHAQHGKDTTAEILRDLFGLRFESSSEAASRIFLYDALKEKYGYKTPKECFLDRVNHRAEWHDLIFEYNKEDLTRLARAILETNEVYVGMRHYMEIDACRKAGLFDFVLGVFDPYKPLEPKSSFNIDLWQHSDFIIPNVGSKLALRDKLKLVFKTLTDGFAVRSLITAANLPVSLQEVMTVK